MAALIEDVNNFSSRRQCSIASGSTDSNLMIDEMDAGDVFVTSSSEMTLPLKTSHASTPKQRVSSLQEAGSVGSSNKR